MTTYRKVIAAVAGEAATVSGGNLPASRAERSDSATGLQYLGGSEEFEF